MNDPRPVPAHYCDVLRTLLRFAAAMTIFALLSGVAFQESSKRLSYSQGDPSMRLDAILSLALVHGHAFLVTVLIPIAMGGALLIARKIGGRELGRTTLLWLTRGYLPSATVTLALMLYKGYHVLLSVRFGARDFEQIDAAFFGGVIGLRHAVYGLAHVAMAVSLGIFVVALWRSLRRDGTNPPPKASGA